jgi:DNA-directed RNA polymerase specialized sigma24 family protein
MPPDYSTVIRMYDLEGRGAESVASAMGRSTGAVYMLRSRAHDMLRTLIEGSDFFTGTS